MSLIALTHNFKPLPSQSQLLLHEWLINHSCDNNCDYDGKGLKLWVKAIRDIKKGEELTCDYGFGYDENYKQFKCKCKSKNCCGYIVRSESRWRINRKFAMTNKNKLINHSR